MNGSTTPAHAFELLVRLAETGVRAEPTRHGLRLHGDASRVADARRLLRGEGRREVARLLRDAATRPDLAHAEVLCREIRRLAVEYVERRLQARLQEAVARLFGLRLGMLPTRHGSRLRRDFRREVLPWLGRERETGILDHCWFFRPPSRGARARVIASHPYAPPPAGLAVACMLAGWRLWRPAFPSWWAPGRTHLVVLERTREAAELAAFRRRVWREVIHEAAREARP